MKIKLLTALTAALLTAGAAQAELVDFSQYNNIYHVSTSGSDSNTGTAQDPFATIKQAITIAQSGDAISIGAGQFDATLTRQSYNYGYYYQTGLNNQNKDIDFIGTAGQTTLYIDGAAAPSRDIHFFSGRGISRIYGLSFIRATTGRGQTYRNAIFGGEVNVEVYNSVFKSINTNVISMTYNNNSSSNVLVSNSAFDINGNATGFSASYSGSGPNVVIKNSASNIDFNYDRGTTYINNATGVTFDENYNITSGETDVGVYSGANAWNVNAPVALGFLALGGMVFSGSRRKKNAQ